MIWRFSTTTREGVEYLTGYALVREIGVVENDDETDVALDRIVDGALRPLYQVDRSSGGAAFVPVAEPEIDGDIALAAAHLVPSPDPRRELVAQALPDILLAVADGADLATEVRKVLDTLKPEEQSGTPV